MTRRRGRRRDGPDAHGDPALPAAEADTELEEDLDGPPPPGAIVLPAPRHTPVYAALSRILLRLETRVRAAGSTSVRWATRAVWAVVALVGVLLLFGPVINKPLSFDDITSSASTATERWIARSFTSDVEILRDDGGRMSMRVHETIEVYFPDDVSDDRIERVIASQYEGHDLHPTIERVTLDGTQVDPRIARGATRTTVAVVEDDDFSGDHIVEYEYTLHDVAFTETDASTRLTEEVVLWDAFGPSWPHGVAESHLTITVGDDLVDAYSRQPSAGIAWLLVGDSVTLTPDRDAGNAVVYTVDNDQNIPPHAQFWFDLRFQPGTFAMPPPSALFWIQAVGPFVPLILLAVTLLFALAARAVAWSDARGRAWFISQSAPQSDVSPALATRLTRTVQLSPLVDAVAAYQLSPQDSRRRRALVRAARRAGRAGNLPAAWLTYLDRVAWREQFTRGLRRIPRGFVRDSFLGASLALTVVQWGLVRQLSYQFALSVYWWPVAIVVVTTALALIVVAIALTARPLTRQGALRREHLLGLELYLAQTSGLERTSLKDRLLPYAVMFARPRDVRRSVAALVEEAGFAREKIDDPDFVTGPRLAVRILSVVPVLVALALVIWAPVHLRGTPEDEVYSGDLPGDYGVFVQEFRSDATVVGAEDGRLGVEVEERLSADVGSNYRDVPQVLRQWRDVVGGHDMGLSVESVTVDGAAVPFDVGRTQGMALLQTRIGDEWPGEHEIIIRYTLADAVGTVNEDGQWRDQLRWTALTPGWDYGWSGVDHEVEDVSFSISVPQEIVDDATTASGWFERVRFRDELELTPFGRGEASGDLITYDLALVDDDGWWGSAGHSDIGVQLQFPDGTYGEPRPASWVWFSITMALPFAVPLIFGAVAVCFALIGLVVQAVAPERLRGGILRDLVRWVPPWLTAAQLVSWFWASVEASADDPVLWQLGIPLVISAVLSIAVLYSTRRRTRRSARTD
ncbi:hypothetical protein GCM10009775_26710 [Microbacterium aoyamense]|uniref:DUF2207 domain-containing protein n=1 Tax=Microbacterium aoyamense TaxID=344166 RepID=A0ABN2PV57_9MICO|nr:DUF2207 domain-containing protein [Microbacterium aoyamense]